MTYLENVLATLTLGVDNLSVVNDDSIAVSATFRIDPANALGELDIRVRQEEL